MMPMTMRNALPNKAMADFKIMSMVSMRNSLV
jgi:hypothetical protein